MLILIAPVPRQAISAGETLEGLEHHVAHGADVGLDAGQAIGIGLAILGALLVGALALRIQLAVQALQHRIVGEGLARHRGGYGQAAADQRGDGGGEAIVAEDLANLLQDRAAFGHVLHRGQVRNGSDLRRRRVRARRCAHDGWTISARAKPHWV